MEKRGVIYDEREKTAQTEHTSKLKKAQKREKNKETRNKK